MSEISIASHDIFDSNPNQLNEFAKCVHLLFEHWKALEF